ncbi:hypothetical protein CERSUDRAFT_78180 [Gelatoporia subvermispora B]|uniref:Uncharacterized protein n=1 Tax=Ceriporiopsis subvermispora (strain B) TaxID=914234 RepID=M2QH84_CERS8|nr:hypothetical protein CERSUDRAFT_78180 [Gelatoporia subvermispora B]
MALITLGVYYYLVLSFGDVIVVSKPHWYLVPMGNLHVYYVRSYISFTPVVGAFRLDCGDGRDPKGCCTNLTASNIFVYRLRRCTLSTVPISSINNTCLRTSVNGSSKVDWHRNYQGMQYICVPNCILSLVPIPVLILTVGQDVHQLVVRNPPVLGTVVMVVTVMVSQYVVVQRFRHDGNVFKSLYFALPDDLVFIAFYYISSKHLNALLARLNVRETLNSKKQARSSGLRTVTIPSSRRIDVICLNATSRHPGVDNHAICMDTLKPEVREVPEMVAT